MFLVIFIHFSIVKNYAVLKYAKDLTDAFNYVLQAAKHRYAIFVAVSVSDMV